MESLVFNNSLFCDEPFTKREAYLDLKSMKNALGKIQVTQRDLAARWKWSRGKVIRFLKSLVDIKLITSTSRDDCTIVSLTEEAECSTDRSSERSTLRSGETLEIPMLLNDDRSSERSTLRSGEREKERGKETEKEKEKERERKRTKKKEKEKEREKDKEKAKEKENSNVLGEFKNVFLSDTDLIKLKDLYPSLYNNYIERLSSYIKSKGLDRHYKDHYATIVNWILRRNEGHAQDNECDGGSSWNGDLQTDEFGTTYDYSKFFK